jgi:integrase
VLLLTTGLRIGEATALEWPDLNLERSRSNWVMPMAA